MPMLGLVRYPRQDVNYSARYTFTLDAGVAIFGDRLPLVRVVTHFLAEMRLISGCPAFGASLR